MLFYQSYEVDDFVATRRLRDELDQYNDFPAQDCIGMTPLHILACSTKQRIEMYTLLVQSYPVEILKRHSPYHSVYYYLVETVLLLLWEDIQRKED